LVSLPVTVPLLWLETHRPVTEPYEVGILLTLLMLFVLAMGPWIRRIHGGRRPWRRLGVRGRGWGVAWVYGWTLGIAGVVGLYGLQWILGWAAWGPLPEAMGRVVVEGTLAAVLVGFGEELFFRGWLLMELEADYAPGLALALDAGLFALAHYIRPWSAIVETWPQFIGLLMLGVMLVWARRCPLPGSQRSPRRPPTAIAFPAGLHGGLVWAYYQVSVGDLLPPTGRVPAWVTGLGGNPLAGAMGLGLLGLLASLVYRYRHRLTR
jgi:membrane protease YdiL (CAAX protease family)